MTNSPEVAVTDDVNELKVRDLLSTITLINVDTQLEVFEDLGSDDVQLSYHCEFQRPTPLDDDGKMITVVNVSAGKRLVKDPDSRTRVAATYGVIYQPGFDEETDRDFIVISVWQRFSALFDLVATQMNAGLPPLLTQPTSVTLVERPNPMPVAEE